MRRAAPEPEPEPEPEPSPEPEPPPTSAEKMATQLDALAVNGFKFNEDEGAFIYFIPVMYNQDSDAIAETSITSYLKRLKWIDRQTREVRVRMAVYNGNYMLFGIVEVTFTFGLGGLLHRNVDVSVLDLEAYTFYSSTDELIFNRVLRLTLELLVVAGVVSKIVGEFQDAIETKKLHGTYAAYFGPWNIMDCISIAMYSICIMYWLVFYSQMSMVDIPKTEPLREAPPKGDPGGKLQALDWAHPDFLGDLLDMTDNMMDARLSFNIYKLVSSLNLFITLALFFKFARHQQRLAIVNKTFEYALPDLLHFFIIFFVVLVFFVMAARIIFGADWVEYTTFMGALLVFFSTTINGAGIADMSATGDSVHNVTSSAVIFWLIFQVLIFMIVLNMLLGILVGAYDAAAEEAGDAPSLLESFQDEIARRNKAKKAPHVDHDGDGELDEPDDEIEDDTLGALREISIAYRNLVGREMARVGISQLRLREMLTGHDVPHSQIDYLFSKYVNPVEEDEGDDEDDDDYNAFEEAEALEEEAKQKAKEMESGHGAFAPDADGDGICDTEERAIEAKEKLEKLKAKLENREKELVARDLELSKMQADVQAEVAEMRNFLTLDSTKLLLGGLQEPSAAKPLVLFEPDPESEAEPEPDGSLPGVPLTDSANESVPEAKSDAELLKEADTKLLKESDAELLGKSEPEPEPEPEPGLALPGVPDTDGAPLLMP